MSITSDEIKNKAFSTRLRGYDQAEVASFLNEVSQAYRDLDQKNQDLEEKLDRLTERLDEYVEKHDSLNRSILVAQDAADRLKEDAHAEANHLVTEAREEADRVRQTSKLEARQILSEAIDNVHFVQEEMEALRQESVRFKKGLHDMVKTYHSTLMDNRWDKVMSLKTFKQIDLDKTQEAVELKAKLSDQDQAEDQDSSFESSNDQPDQGQIDQDGQRPAQEIPAGQEEDQKDKDERSKDSD